VSLAKIRATGCKHFTGSINKTCKAGVEYRQLSPGPGCLTRIPCLPESPYRSEPMATCGRFELYTAAEVEQLDADSASRTHFTLKLFQEIKAIGLMLGKVVCPKCSGWVHFKVAQLNGHVWARCETENCLAFMQ
jgi:hypothetical protein